MSFSDCSQNGFGICGIEVKGMFDVEDKVKSPIFGVGEIINIDYNCGQCTYWVQFERSLEDCSEDDIQLFE
jgi:hypothetical protein